MVLVSSNPPLDPASGVGHLEALVQRLRAQASHMPIVLMHEEAEVPEVPGVAAAVRCPPALFQRRELDAPVDRASI